MLGKRVYKGYKLSDKVTLRDLSNEQIYALDACIWMVKCEETIHYTAMIWEYPYTTFWRRIHKTCKCLSPELYKDVCKQIKKNLNNRGKKKKV